MHDEEMVFHFSDSEESRRNCSKGSVLIKELYW